MAYKITDDEFKKKLRDYFQSLTTVPIRPALPLRHNEDETINRAETLKDESLENIGAELSEELLAEAV